MSKLVLTLTITQLHISRRCTNSPHTAPHAHVCAATIRSYAQFFGAAAYHVYYFLGTKVGLEQSHRKTPLIGQFSLLCFVWHKVSTTTAIQEEIHCLDPQITTGTSPGIQIFPDYRLPISRLMFFLELLISQVCRGALLAMQLSAILISHRVGEACREL